MATTTCTKCGRVCSLIFRWPYQHPKTGQIIKAKKRPMPIPQCGCK